MLPDLVHQRAVDFFILDSQVSNHDRGTGVINPFTDYLKSHPVFCSLYVSPGLS